MSICLSVCLYSVFWNGNIQVRHRWEWIMTSWHMMSWHMMSWNIWCCTVLKLCFDFDSNPKLWWLRKDPLLSQNEVDKRWSNSRTTSLTRPPSSTSSATPVRDSYSFCSTQYMICQKLRKKNPLDFISSNNSFPSHIWKFLRTTST